MSRVLGKVHGTSLPLPLFGNCEDSRLSAFKRFCTDPLERKPHMWDSAVMGLSRRSRFSIWMTLFQFRKVLPKSPPDLDDLLSKISQESPDPDPLFLEFLAREVPRMFPEGWDRSWSKLVEGFVLNTSACVQSGRRSGGARGYFLGLNEDGTDPRKEFCRELLEGRRFGPQPPSRLSNIETSGKFRTISVPPADFSYLRPVNDAIYGWISRFKWLLRGDAKPSSFKEFLVKEGEVFVSGDYESATDCLNVKVQREILRLILQSARSIPNDLKRLAFSSLSTSVVREDDHGLSGNGPKVYPVLSGQMMGYPLSFPLLCIVNYLTFRYCTMDWSLPVRVNGDDIVFRSSERQRQRWMEGVSAGGLVLSKGKTLVDRKIFILNSKLFAATSSRVMSLPFIRPKALFGRGEDDAFYSVTGRYNSFCPGYYGEKRFRLRCFFLRQNIGWIVRSRRSLYRGLGMRVDERILKTSRLWSREVGLLSLPREEKVYVPKSMWSVRPEGFEIAYSDVKMSEPPGLKEAIVACAWKKGDVDDMDYDEEYIGGANPSKLDEPRLARLAGISARECRDLLSASAKRVWESRAPPRFPYWKESLSSTSNSVRFVNTENSRPYFSECGWSRPARTDCEYGEVEGPVPPVNVGPAMVWDCRGEDQRLTHVPLLGRVGCGAKLKVFSNGVGIGPPLCF